ncbi:hypothetical protein CAEBREN_30698 [Caenorhabditis brenneri]|uniref:ShKT domain-containing protein n=1 Tax=Caenorhabditis brenneri TaxID=135651 RepID=G0NAQ4_CAEBE|nr:hypothetical protein CAEBREN_30698 [Caenorhabditis brenneri]
MFKSLALLALLAFSSALALHHRQTTCRVSAVGPSVSGLCPSGYTRITNGDCCASQQVASGSTCVDKTSFNGVNECPGLRSYCNNSLYRTLMTDLCPKTCGFCTPSTTCVDLVNPTTGRSECTGNIGLCNNSVYR